MPSRYNISLDPVDEQAIRNLPRKDAVAWMCAKEVNELLLRNHRNRVIGKVFSPGVIIPSLPERQAAYVPIKVVWNALLYVRRKEMPVCLPLVFSTIFCSQRFTQTSCHSLMFGTHKPIMLSDKYHYVVESLEFISGALYKKLLGELQEAPLFVTNPAAIIQRRITEVASKEGVPVLTFAYNLFDGSVNAKKRLPLFFAEPLPWLLPNNSFLTKTEPVNYWNSIELIWKMVFLASLFCDLSADYFMMQDFSEYALYNYFPLNPKQREFLSAFLLATPEAQDSVLAKLVAARF